MACAATVVPDGEWCGDAGSLGGMCFHTLTDETREVPQPAWDAERFGMICGTPDTFAAMKAVTLKLCKQNKRCSFEDKAAIERFGERVEEMKTKLRLAGDDS